MQKGPGTFSVLVAAGFLVWGPSVTTAEAQPWTVDFWKGLGVAGTVSFVQPADSEVDPVVMVGGGVGFFPDHGWGPAIGFSWFETDVSVDGVPIGRLKVRPVLGGVGYTWVRGRFATKASVTAGVVFNRASLDRSTTEGIDGPTSLDVRDSFALRTAASLEYSLVRKLAVRGTLAWLATRPSTVITTSQGQTRGTWNASNGMLQGGVVFYPFR